MRPEFPIVCAALMAACVPDYHPDADSGTDWSGEATTCDPPLPVLPDEVVPLRTITGYDHGAGVSGDVGVIHHEAFVVDGPESFTMLSFQDFRGPDAVRAAGCCVIWTDPECGDPETDPRCEDPECIPEIIPVESYVDLPVAVLFLIGCPYESMGGCERQFLAVSGTATFLDFEKPDDSWHLDTLDGLGVRLDSLVLREVEIDPIGFDSVFTCANCSQSISLGPYEFSYVSG